VPTINLTYYGMEGTGRTLTEAKKDAGAKIERALSGDYSPRIIRRKGYAALVYREPSGWHYCCLANEHGLVRDDLPGSMYCGTLADAIDSATFHVAQNAWDGEEGEAFDALAKGLSRERKSELHTWSLWQLRWRHAVKHGFSREEAWQWASDQSIATHAQAMASVPQKPAA
jgi:hypothetical protein